MRRNNTLSKVYKLEKGDIVINLGYKEEYKMYKILYVNGGGFLAEGYLTIKSKGMCKSNKIFIRHSLQINQFKNISFSTNDISVLLSKKSSIYPGCEFSKAFYLMINRKINENKSEKETYKRLYDYYSAICHSKEEFFKENMGEHYINISYDYDKIKNSKKKLHTELIRNFKLFSIKEFNKTNIKIQS